MISPLLSLKSYVYKLPEALIAQHPLFQREKARLMVLNRIQQTIVHDTFDHIERYLPPRTAFVINNTKVIPARLLGQKLDTHGQVEVFLLGAVDDGLSFEALLKPLKRIRPGQTLDFGHGLQAQLVDKAKRIVKFNPSIALRINPECFDFAQHGSKHGEPPVEPQSRRVNRNNVLKILQKVGHVPLPPYIKRQDEASDYKNYQTIYARKAGSVAAPTAGLHFTNSLMHRLKQEGHQFLEVTLHINYGTFKPVACEDIRSHVMHEEYYDIPVDVYQKILKMQKNHQNICAVGTTSCRVLESLGKGVGLRGRTNLFVYPGFSFTMTNCLLTNFHLPCSSLLMLVCAFGGYDLVMRAYQEAIKEKYRFYSYGDAMLII